MPKFRKLLRAAIIVPVTPNPDVQRWGAQALGQGTVVEVMDDRLDEPPPISPEDVLVRFKDAGARDVLGYLARRTVLKPSGGPLNRVPFNSEDDGLTCYDWVRERITNSGLQPLSWLATEGPKHLDLLRDVVRELGGSLKKADDESQVIKRIARLILNREVSMSEVEEARDAAPAKSGKKNGKKAKAKSNGKAKAEKATRTPAGVGVGEILVPLLKGNGGAKLAARLAKGESLGKKQLTELRDAINEAAATAREKKQGKVSSALSAANRQVRRLARAA